MASRPEAERGGRPRAPLIGHAGPLVKLFRVNGQRLTEAAAAGRAQPVGGGGRGCRGNRATSSWLPLAGRLCCAAPSGSSGSLSGGRVLILFPCRAAGTGRRHPQLSTPEHPLPTRGAQVKKKGGGRLPGAQRGRGSSTCTGRLPSWGIENCEVEEGALPWPRCAEGGGGVLLDAAKWVGFA